MERLGAIMLHLCPDCSLRRQKHAIVVNNRCGTILEFELSFGQLSYSIESSDDSDGDTDYVWAEKKAEEIYDAFWSDNKFEAEIENYRQKFPRYKVLDWRTKGCLWTIFWIILYVVVKILRRMDI